MSAFVHGSAVAWLLRSAHLILNFAATFSGPVIKWLGAAMPGLDIPDPVLKYVAQSVVSNGRDLEGALNRLVAQWQFTNVPVTISSAEITLRDLIGRSRASAGQNRGNSKGRLPSLQRLQIRPAFEPADQDDRSPATDRHVSGQSDDAALAA